MSRRDMVNVVDLADAILHAAVGSDADRVWIDPVPLAEACYAISIERRGSVIATSTLDEQLATGVIARLAVLAEIDDSHARPSDSPAVATARATTGSTRIRRGTRSCELVVMVRPGAQPRAELMLARDERSSDGTFRELQTGDIVDHYRVLERLGAGGMGRVYKVDHLTLGRSYALKVLHSEVLQRDPRSADRFVREARAASRIRHPNIIDVFDFGYLRDGRPYFVMELLDSTSLGDHIDEHGSLEPNRALTIARQLVDALRAAHDAGVIHADVTPSNILVADSRVKLVDFGLAELSEAVQVDETATHVMGTPRYVAPERLLGRASSEACDQYSLGIVMFEMLSGVTPFNAPDLKSLCRQHIQDPPPSVLSPFAPLPPELDRMVARCLEKSPGHRFPNMGALAAELEEVAWLVGQEARRAAS